MTPFYSPSGLRTDLYRLLDRAREAGVPLEVERKARRLRIVPAETGGRLAILAPDADYPPGEPKEFVHLDWSGEWRP